METGLERAHPDRVDHVAPVCHSVCSLTQQFAGGGEVGARQFDERKGDVSIDDDALETALAAEGNALFEVASRSLETAPLPKNLTEANMRQTRGGQRAPAAVGGKLEGLLVRSRRAAQLATRLMQLGRVRHRVHRQEQIATSVSNGTRIAERLEGRPACPACR